MTTDAFQPYCWGRSSKSRHGKLQFNLTRIYPYTRSTPVFEIVISDGMLTAVREHSESDDTERFNCFNSWASLQSVQIPEGQRSVLLDSERLLSSPLPFQAVISQPLEMLHSAASVCISSGSISLRFVRHLTDCVWPVQQVLAVDLLTVNVLFWFLCAKTI